MTRRILAAVLLAITWMGPAAAQDGQRPRLQGRQPELRARRAARPDSTSAHRARRWRASSAPHSGPTTRAPPTFSTSTSSTKASRPPLGPTLAEQLSFVLSARSRIDFGSLPDRPDGMDTTGSEREPMVGGRRARACNSACSTCRSGRSPFASTASRSAMRIPYGSSRARASSRSLTLFAHYGPTAFEKSLPEALRQETAFGILVWELIALPLIGAFAILAAWLTWTAMTVSANRIPVEAVTHRDAPRPPADGTSGGRHHPAVRRSPRSSSSPSGTDATLSIIFWILIISAIIFGVSRIAGHGDRLHVQPLLGHHRRRRTTQARAAGTPTCPPPSASA